MATKNAKADALPIVLELIEQFCRDYLNDEYAVVCRKLAENLARKRPSPLASGKPSGWASGIIRTIGMVNFLGDPSQKKGEPEKGDKSNTNGTYPLCSPPLCSPQHWSIESSLHWVLDVTFTEDKSRIRKQHAPQTSAMLRRLAVSILSQDTSIKDNIRGKRYRACLAIWKG